MLSSLQCLYPQGTGMPHAIDGTDVLVLSPQTFLKLQFFLHAGESEVCGFGISCPQNLLYLRDFVTLPQRVSPVSVSFEAGAVADHVDAMTASGLSAQQAGHVWIVLRAGSSAQPSRSDERSFERAMGHADWSVLLIMARSGQTYARLQYRAGPRSRLLLPARVHWPAWSQSLADPQIQATAHRNWKEEYHRNVQLEQPLATGQVSLCAQNLSMAPAPEAPLLTTWVPMEPEPVE